MAFLLRLPSTAAGLGFVPVIRQNGWRMPQRLRGKRFDPRSSRAVTTLPQRDPVDRFLAATAQVMDDARHQRRKLAGSEAIRTVKN